MADAASTLLLGIDVGTTNCKVTLYDVSGRALRSGGREYAMSYPHPGWVEEDADEWWRAVADGIRQVLWDPDLAKRIAGVGVGCTNALVAVDADGRALRPAIMQLDQRTVPQAEELKAILDSKHLSPITGNRVAPGSFSAPLILWLRQHEPQVFRATHKFLVPSGFIVHRLTGKFSMDHSRASTTLLFDVRRRKWSPEICREAGIPVDKLPDLYEPWQVVGRVSREAALETGLLQGTPVVAGCMDTVGAAVGSGVLSPGASFIIMGTVARLVAVLGKPCFDDRFLNCCYAVPGTWLAIAATNAAGASLRWFRDKFGQMEVAVGHEAGLDPYDLLTAEAARSVPGARGLIYLPYLAAERSPIWDPYARGVLFGLTLSHERGDIIRALLEGVALSIRHNLEILEHEMGLSIELLRIGGAGSRSALWMQIIADVLGKPLITLRAQETETLGVAILAGIGSGLYNSFEQACQQTLAEDRKWFPRNEYRALYRELFSLYTTLYLDLKPRFEGLARLVEAFQTM